MVQLHVTVMNRERVPNLLVFCIWQLALFSGQVLTMACSSVPLTWWQPIKLEWSSGKRRRMSLAIDEFSSGGRQTAHSKAKAVTKWAQSFQSTQQFVTFDGERRRRKASSLSKPVFYFVCEGDATQEGGLRRDSMTNQPSRELSENAVEDRTFVQG